MNLLMICFFLPVFVGKKDDGSYPDLITGANSADILAKAPSSLGGYNVYDNVAYVIYCKEDVSLSMGGAKIKSGDINNTRRNY